MSSKYLPAGKGEESSIQFMKGDITVKGAVMQCYSDKQGPVL
jgi:hypothetical protein